MSKIVTLSEVAEHKSKNDCWIMLFGWVYDVTSFLEEHPGCDDVVLAEAGKDATGPSEDVGHSHDAWGMLDKFYVGNLDQPASPAKTNTDTPLVHGKKGINHVRKLTF